MKNTLTLLLTALLFSCNQPVQDVTTINASQIDSIVDSEDLIEQQELHAYYTDNYGNTYTECGLLNWDSDILLVFADTNPIGILYDDIDQGYYHEFLSFGTDCCEKEFIDDWHTYLTLLDEPDSLRTYIDAINTKYCVSWYNGHFMLWYHDDNSFRE